MGTVSAPAFQVELPLRVAVCAWCKPDARGSTIGEVSHGICPRHLRQLKFEIRGIVVKRRRRSSLRTLGPEGEAFLPLY